MALLAVLFCLGLALGSFLQVLASRYDPDRFVLNRGSLGGRSHCPHCRKTLAWYELVPVLSFLMQAGRCRGCGAAIGWSHVWTELIAGCIVAGVPATIFSSAALAASHAVALAAVWTAAFLVLLLISLIDLRLFLIPDELTAAIGALGLAAAALGTHSLLDPYAAFFGGQGNILLNHLAAGAGAALFFGMLVAVTRGRGMGAGDVKLAFALGLLFGWPDTLPVIMLAFVLGAAVGIGLILGRRKHLKSALPFGPFLALAAGLVFFAGQAMLTAYINALSL